jgi:hypothetical protein
LIPRAPDEEDESDDVDEGGSNRSHAERTQTTTKSGNKVHINRHLFDNYQFTGVDILPDAYTPSVQTTFGNNATKDHEKWHINDEVIEYAFTQYSLKQGLRKFPIEGPKATMDEMKQLHKMHTFKPVHGHSMTAMQKRAALASLIFIKQKRCGRVKARACADGRQQRMLYEKHEASSPTVKTESVILSAVQDAAEERNVVVTDIQGAFLNAKLDELVHMVLVGPLAELLIEAVPGVYDAFATTNSKGQTIMYVILTRALYRCLKSALQFWKHLSTNLLKSGYILNKYDTCVATKLINGTQCTIMWHVDDLKISHVDEEVVNNEIASRERIYGKMVTTRGKEHTYLGMDFDFSIPGEVSMSMAPYMEEIVDEYPCIVPAGAKTPAANHLFDDTEESTLPDSKQAKIFHHTVAKILWASMRARPDVLTAMSYLTSKVKNPNENDRKKLLRLLGYIRETINLKLILSSDKTAVLKWWTDASFATRADMKSQTGVAMSMGNGAIYSLSKKQKLNTKSSTEAELVGADDILPQMIWTRNFMNAQGWTLQRNLLYQDNQSAMLLEKNGSASSSC